MILIRLGYQVCSLDNYVMKAYIDTRGERRVAQYRFAMDGIQAPKVHINGSS